MSLRIRSPHDLRAPLRSILGFAEMLDEDYARALGEEGRTLLGRVRIAAVRMNELISDLLQLSRAATSEFQRTGLDFTAIAEQVVNNLQENDHKYEVSVDIDPGMRCTEDPRPIKIVLENLLGNAFKLTSQTESPRVRVGTERDRGRAVFYVEDNGTGFDMKYADRLFAPFQRLHTDKEFPGIGIGLATVRRIVRRHNGRIWARSEPGHGCRFSFTLDRHGRGRYTDAQGASEAVE